MMIKKKQNKIYFLLTNPCEKMYLIRFMYLVRFCNKIKHINSLEKFSGNERDVEYLQLVMATYLFKFASAPCIGEEKCF